MARGRKGLNVVREPLLNVVEGNKEEKEDK